MTSKTFGLIAALMLAMAARSQEGGDLQAQILYAYHTEDANSLANLVERLGTDLKAEPADTSLHYHRAHAEYRRGLLASRSSPREAERSFADCIDDLKPLAAQDVKSVEALILQSVCYEELADHRKLEAALLRTRAEGRLKAALAQEPGNPRAVYVSARRLLERAGAGSAERRPGKDRLQLAVRLFDSTSATRPDAPGWGHADAYLALGVELERDGDRLGARNWIEKALIAAPDYKAAQRRLAELGGR